MHAIRSLVWAVMVTMGCMAFGLPGDGGPNAGESPPQARPDTTVDAEFQALLAKLDVAQLELQNGKPDAFKALWSHADDITLSGGFGGTIEQGWEAISRRLDWVGTQFSQGSHRIERLVAHASGDLGYVVQLEHIRFLMPGQADVSRRDYPVTMVFRREAEGWRLVHRQADAQLMQQSPQ
jgi:ketosteroid isomerase-like protein